MIPKGLFAQIAVIIVAIAIVWLNVKPSFEKVKNTQNDIETYQTEREKIVVVNSQLATLVTKMDSISTEEQRRLLTYLPNVIDELRISRDIMLIAKEAGVIYRDVQYAGEEGVSSNIRDEANITPISHFFTLSVEGTYDQVKNLFVQLELNDYPLEVRDVSIAKAEGDFLTTSVTIATYALRHEVSDSNL